MNKGKSQTSPSKTRGDTASKVGDLFKDASLDEYAEKSRYDNSDDEGQILDWEGWKLFMRHIAYV